MRFLPTSAVLLAVVSIAAAVAHSGENTIDRKALVARHSPEVRQIDPGSALTLGNGRFAFTADVTGLQSLPDHYFDRGMPLETKARWAWHSRPNPDGFALEETFEAFAAYGRTVEFPTQQESAAGQWLRQNPHDLPLARIGLQLDGKPPGTEQVSGIDQRLDLWAGRLSSRFALDKEAVSVETVVHPSRDALAVAVESPLLQDRRLAIAIAFPRGYDPAVKNTPDLVWGPAGEHVSELLEAGKHYAIIRRRVDDAEHIVSIRWSEGAALERVGDHRFVLAAEPGAVALQAVVEFSPRLTADDHGPTFTDAVSASAAAWSTFWQTGGAIDFSGSTDPRAAELERRIVLSRYLLAVQSRAAIPTQETGLTSSSWYGKHHTEMKWWHSAHWALWGQPGEVRRVLDWYQAHLGSARRLAASRGLSGARWAKMVGPGDRESPGGNPLIIWNQPQPIHLAEMLLQADPGGGVLERYADLVEQTADAMASMLVRDDDRGRYSLAPPIWIAQEIYPPRETRNPSFELAYWRYGLEVAQRWRARRGLPRNEAWQRRLEHLAGLPLKDGRLVAIESIPDTFDNVASRQDHPTMLAPVGLLNDPTVDPDVMHRTLDAVLAGWDWDAKIWGWDYPMIAMTAARLGRSDDAVDILLAERTHNRYLANGHCPQPGAGLPVYLPANGALLAAVAMMAAGWDGAPRTQAPGFPDDGTWRVRVEGISPYAL